MRRDRQLGRTDHGPDGVIPGLQPGSGGQQERECIVTERECWTTIFDMPALGEDVDDFKATAITVTVPNSTTLHEYTVPKGKTLALMGFGWETQEHAYSGISVILTVTGDPVSPFDNTLLYGQRYGGVGHNELCKCHLLFNQGDVVGLKLKTTESDIAGEIIYSRLKGLLFDIDCR